MASFFYYGRLSSAQLDRWQALMQWPRLPIAVPTNNCVFVRYPMLTHPQSCFTYTVNHCHFH